MWLRDFDKKDTIFALVSGKLPSAVGVVRLSGPESFEIAKKLFIARNGREIQKRRELCVGALRDILGKKIDDILLLTFVAPNSLTGEDVIELHCHGSVPIIENVRKVLGELGARAAERGEFSYRAYLNGKMKPSDLEALGDIFLATNAVDLRRIYERRDGSVERFVGSIRTRLLDLQAILDTAVDFSEEYQSVVQRAFKACDESIHECSKAIHRYSSFKDGAIVPRIVITGRSNAGKSSLFNALLGRYRAIVHEHPGTTRDAIEEDIEVASRRWKLVDTAGLRAMVGEVERQGLSLGSDFLGAASLWILVVDGTLGLGTQERELLSQHGTKSHIIVWNKKDLKEWGSPEPDVMIPDPPCLVSAKTGEGIEILWGIIEERLESLESGDDDIPMPSRVQVARLERVVATLRELCHECRLDVPPEFLAEKNRMILRQLEYVIGEVTVEDVLDRIFAEFCIGK